MREIKVRYRIKLATGEIRTEIVNLEDIENGYLKEYISPNCKILSRALYTGLKDRNKKEICEGDIIKDYYEGKCKELEVINGKITKWEGKPAIVEIKDIRHCGRFEGADMRYFEVIGNIYENKVYEAAKKKLPL